MITKNNRSHYDDLSRQELIDILELKDELIQAYEANKELKEEITKINKATQTANPEWLHGIRGLAQYLSISLATAQKLKDSGKFPVYWTGKKVHFKSNEVTKGLI